MVENGAAPSVHTCVGRKEILRRGKGGGVKTGFCEVFKRVGFSFGLVLLLLLSRFYFFGNFYWRGRLFC